jgi:hypothetical protein
MAFFLVLVLLVIMAGSLSAQSAEEYCSSEKTQGEACYQQCCEGLGYTYSGGCNVPDANQDDVAMQCMYCTDEYMSCVDYYEQQLAGGPSYPDNGSSSSGSGCCASVILLSLLGFACLRTRN